MTQELRDRPRHQLVVTTLRSELARRPSGTDPMTAETTMAAANRRAEESLDHMRNMVRSELNSTLDRELTRAFQPLRRPVSDVNSASPRHRVEPPLRRWGGSKRRAANILKHSSAAKATIMLVEDGHSYVLLIENDSTPGDGEPIAPLPRSIADRTGRLGGTVSTMESGGTFTLDARLPAPQSDLGHGEESPSLEEGNA